MVRTQAEDGGGGNLVKVARPSRGRFEAGLAGEFSRGIEDFGQLEELCGLAGSRSALGESAPPSKSGAFGHFYI